ncbi:putative short-subunit dehydrogenase-like oxidoreductase (DUF2520 family) [Ruminiclostridium sufflavum DSM 19573]|uniref:Putative short-subunit dehydrogenase-like oxidoreductase (DUF2520 family) n=1 Tax=Ruminiclostridium sufflavum DSM 19573 TaxID=1121337 RepID=A0A318XKY5_9FIRM|nr:Rossmann-like and DUF2520 domain-containing protein [Ruminiclostridium sufflavum]PYG85754.1 putative short-subunit dehydrogenase-like oxidoreductase (DUF2520 family) [Ruminiclostridium sufflavum DSM 19573]
MKIGFIGAGKVGFSLGKYFCEQGLKVTGYFSRNPQSALQAAEFTGTMYFKDIESIVEASDTLFLTVPDGAIKELWDYIEKLSIKNKIICHCSGSISSSVFSNIDDHNAYGYSIHPLLGISDKLKAYEELSHAFFTIEGSQCHLNEMQMLLKSLGNSVQIISPENKAVYHSAAVFASNLMVALAQTSIDLLGSCGFNEQAARLALNALMLGNMKNIVKQGPIEALTGPVERCDTETVMKHLSCLSGDDRKLYILLSRKLIDIAKRKKPDCSFAQLETMMGEC